MSDVEYVDITRDEESQGTLSLAVRWHGKHLLGAENASIPLIMIHVCTRKTAKVSGKGLKQILASSDAAVLFAFGL